MASYKDHDISCKPPPKDGWSACYRKECIDGTIYDFSHAPGDDEKKRSLAGEADCKARGYEGIEDPGKQENWVNCQDFHFAFRCKGSLKKPDPPDAPATTTGAEDTNDDTPPPPEPDLLTSLLSPTSLISFAAMAGFYFMSRGKKAEADPLEALIARQNAALAPPPGAAAPPPPPPQAAAPPPPPQASEVVPAPALPQDAPELFEPTADEESNPLLLVVLVTAVVLGAIAWNREAVLQSMGPKKNDEDEDEKISG